MQQDTWIHVMMVIKEKETTVLIGNTGVGDLGRVAGRRHGEIGGKKGRGKLCYYFN